MILCFAAVVVVFLTFGMDMSYEIEAQGALARGRRWVERDRPNKARSEYEFFLRIKPSEQRVRSELMGLLIDQRLDQPALESAEEAVKYANREDLSVALALKGEALLASGRLEEAKSAFYQSIEKAPGSAQAVMGLAKIEEKSKRYEEMIELFADGFALDGGNSSYTFEREHRRLLEALWASERLLKKNPSTQNICDAATLCRRIGDWPTAMIYYKEAAKQRDSPAEAYYWLGVDAEAREMLEEALGRYRDALGKDSSHAPARENFDRCQEILLRREH